MKKILFALIAITTLHADPVQLVAKVVPEDSRGYLVFSDGTFWNVSSFVKRWRSPLEWIAGNELYVPEDYECELSDWFFGDEYEVFYKTGNMRVDETHASNEDDLKKHSFLMVNLRSGNTFFASQMQPMDLLTAVHDEGYNVGHSKGYDAGYSLGYSIGYDAGEEDTLDLFK